MECVLLRASNEELCMIFRYFGVQGLTRYLRLRTAEQILLHSLGIQVPSQKVIGDITM